MTSIEDLQKPIPADVAPSTVAHFLSNPYSRPTLHDPNFRILAKSRAVTHQGQGHTLMGKTWNTETTIRGLITLFRPAKHSPPAHSSSDNDNTTTSSSTTLALDTDPATRAEIRRFYTLGSDLTAHPGLLHGGVISCILDSSLGAAVEQTLAEQEGGPPGFTVQLHVSFRAAVQTPGTVGVRSWVTRVEDGGRKAWAEGILEGESGVVFAKATGLWVRPKERGRARI